MISDSLTIGSLWNWNTGFEIHFYTSPSLGFLNYFLQQEKYSSHTDSEVKASIPSPSLWRLKILAEQPEEKLEKSQETIRDVVIAARIHMWADLEVRDEFFAIEG